MSAAHTPWFLDDFIEALTPEEAALTDKMLEIKDPDLGPFKDLLKKLRVEISKSFLELGYQASRIDQLTDFETYNLLWLLVKIDLLALLPAGNEGAADGH